MFRAVKERLAEKFPIFFNKLIANAVDTWSELKLASLVKVGVIS